MRQGSGFGVIGRTACLWEACVMLSHILIGLSRMRRYLSAPYPSFELRSLLSQTILQTYRIGITYIVHCHTSIMASHQDFQAVPPLRTNTVGSQNSQSSDQMSPLSPASPTSRGSSPTERNFFSAITAPLRGRSRSRSRDASRKRSKSPMMASPPRQIGAQPTSPQQPRHVSIASPTQRPRLQQNERTASDPWRGRHSNEWLFGGWSATDAAKDLLKRRNGSS